MQSLILLDFRTVALCAALVATSEAVLAHDAAPQFGTSIIESCRSVGDEARVDLCLDKESDDHSGIEVVRQAQRSTT